MTTAESDISVTLVGTGGPIYNKSRSGPSNLIRCHGKSYLVDMGNGTQAQLAALGINARQLDALLLTHHHLDHNDELVPLLVGVILSGSRAEIIGPPGTKKFVEFIMTYYREDITYRIQRRGGDPTSLTAPSVREVQGGESFMLGPVKVTTTPVNHTIATIAYRFDSGNDSIVISGDLAYSDSLVTLAHDADVLVMDSGSAPVNADGSVERTGNRNNRNAEGAGIKGKAHASREEVCDMATKAGAKN
jgi:ribonuclease BN (tRNA processing enzyme)